MPSKWQSLPAGIKILSSEESDRLTRYSDNLPIKPGTVNCACQGTGSFTTYSLEDYKKLAEYECPCDDQWIAGRALCYNGIDKKNHGLRWADMTNVDREAIKRVQEYLGNSIEYINRGIGLFLYGTKGTGKSAISILVLKRLIANGHTVHCTTFSDLRAGFEATFGKGEAAREDREYHLRRVRNVGVLVLDDIGRSSPSSEKGKDFHAEVLDEVLYHRTEACLPTIISSNLGEKEFAELYGENVMDSVLESCIQIPFRGVNFHQEWFKRKEQEAKNHIARPVVFE